VRKTGLTAAAVMAGLFATTLSFAQQPQTVRLGGVIEKIDGHTVTAKSIKGDELKLNLADKVLVVAVMKASMADIREGEFIGSGAMPQPDGSQKAIEVHIFAESMRGTGEGFRPWDGAPNSNDDEWDGRRQRHRRRGTRHHRQVQGRREENHRHVERADRAF